MAFGLKKMSFLKKKVINEYYVCAKIKGLSLYLKNMMLF